MRFKFSTEKVECEVSKNILMVLTNTNEIDAEHPTGLWLSEFRFRRLDG